MPNTLCYAVISQGESQKDSSNSMPLRSTNASSAATSFFAKITRFTENSLDLKKTTGF